MVLSEILLREYAATGSEDAFRELVARHLPLVYATARRLAGGDAHLAEDIAQVVFRDLALKARALPEGAVVAGWLYRHTSFTASKMLRSDRRRAAREEKTGAMSPAEESRALGAELEPALAQLDPPDRDALVLRYLDERAWAEVGASLGVTPDAAQKRAGRALEKLRAILEREGLTVSLAALGSFLASQVAAAPSALAPRISAAALANLPTMSTTMIGSIQTKVALGALAATVVIAPLWLQNRQLAAALARSSAADGESARLRGELAALRGSSEADLDRLRRENAELYKLRAELGALRRQLQEAQATTTTARREPEPASESRAWQVAVSCRMVEAPEAVFTEVQAMGVALPAPNGSVAIDAAQARRLEEFFKTREGVDLLTAPKVTTLNGRQARVAVEDSVALEDGTTIQVGQVVDVLPTVAADGSSMSLNLEAKTTEFLGYEEANGQRLPRFRTRGATVQETARPGDTVLVRPAEQAGGESGGDRRWLLLVSSAIVNPDGSAFVRKP